MIPVPSLPGEMLDDLRGQFIELLRSTNREGIEELLIYLDEQTDFFTAPASASNHGAVEGGLLMHSLTVYRYLQNFVKPLKTPPPEDSLIISALLHDLCKANFYTKKVRNVKIPGEKRWEEQEYFAIEDQYPMGHGEKSVYLAMKFIKLTDDEALAIRWHMGGYDDAARAYAGGKAIAGAFDCCKLAVALSVADMYVANLIEAQ